MPPILMMFFAMMSANDKEEEEEEVTGLKKCAFFAKGGSKRHITYLTMKLKRLHDKKMVVLEACCE